LAGLENFTKKNKKQKKQQTKKKKQTNKQTKKNNKKPPKKPNNNNKKQTGDTTEPAARCQRMVALRFSPEIREQPKDKHNCLRAKTAHVAALKNTTKPSFYCGGRWPGGLMRWV
jgi:outer membrane biosynthesis protein TonB